MAEADEVSVAGSLSDETESIQSVLEEESVHPLYFLVQWEDRFMSVIHPKDIVTPKKTIYVEGELIEAKYQTKTTTKIYKAVKNEISGKFIITLLTQSFRNYIFKYFLGLNIDLETIFFILSENWSGKNCF